MRFTLLLISPNFFFLAVSLNRSHIFYTIVDSRILFFVYVVSVCESVILYNTAIVLLQGFLCSLIIKMFCLTLVGYIEPVNRDLREILSYHLWPLHFDLCFNAINKRNTLLIWLVFSMNSCISASLQCNKVVILI